MDFHYIKIGSNYYMTANQIRLVANINGVSLPVDENGQTHPGSLFNKLLRSIPGTARTMLGLVPGSIIYFMACENEFACKQMLDLEIISKSSIKAGKVDLYTINAANVILRCLSNNVNFTIIPEEQRTVLFMSGIKLYPKKLTQTKSVAPPLLGKSIIPKQYKVIDQFTPEEQEVIRRYQQLARETRKNGTRKFSRKESVR